MAAAILFAGMLAVMAAIMTGQQNVFEAQFQLQASLLAEGKMQDILQLDYSDIGPPFVEPYEEFDWNDGTIRQLIEIIPRQSEIPGLTASGQPVSVQGKEVTITLDFRLDPMSDNWRPLARLKAFIPQPA